MSVSISGNVSAIYTSLKTMSGLRSTPEHPPEQVSSTPALFIAVDSVNGTSPTQDTFSGTCIVRAGVYVARGGLDIKRAIEITLPYGDSILAKLMELQNACTLNIAGEITADYGPMDYDDTKLFGWTFRIPTQIVVEDV